MQRISADGRIDPAKLDIDALKVIRRLRSFGYEAYLVGGSVRDLWLGRTPKDFDVATDASPRQVKRVFSNCRIIGRRFRLAHVFFGPKIIEVSTFRTNVVSSDEDGAAIEEKDLLVLDDNVFGTAEEDARRRDFTINGLFYDPERHEVIDYVSGIADLERKIIRTIGDPDIRFREDPVRILRAVKFASRLGFEIDSATYEAALRHRAEILRCSPARVNEEIMRLFGGGAARSAVRLMWEMGLLDLLLPMLAEYLANSKAGDDDPLWRWLAALDAIDRTMYPIGPGLVVGAAFWPIIERNLAAGETLDYGHQVELAVDGVARAVRLPRRESALLKQAIIARRRLLPPDGQRKRRGGWLKMRGKAYFQAAVALCTMELMAKGVAAEDIAKLQHEWMQGGPLRSTPHVESGETRAHRRRRRRRRGGRPQEAAAPPAGD